MRWLIPLWGRGIGGRGDNLVNAWWCGCWVSLGAVGSFPLVRVRALVHGVRQVGAWSGRRGMAMVRWGRGRLPGRHESRAPARGDGRGSRLWWATARRESGFAASVATVLAVSVPVLHQVVMWLLHLL